MNLMHVSERKNRNSILKYGLLPTKVKNWQHLDYFKKHKKIKGEKAIYTWLDSEYNEKFIKDLLYAKVWIHPRNTLFDYYSDTFDDYINFKKVSRFPFIQHDTLYDVYLIEKANRSSDMWHGQIPSDNIYNSCYNMEDCYAHDNKIVYVYDEPVFITKIIGSAYYYFDNNKIHIKVLN